MFGLFNKKSDQIDKDKASALLEEMKKANLPKIKEMVDQFPLAIFVKVKQAGASSAISPLEYACSTYDFRAFKYFYEMIKKSYPGKLANLFKIECRTIKYDMSPLRKAYNDFLEFYREWYGSKYDYIDDLKQAWSEIGKEQMLLPWNMLKEFSHKGIFDHRKVGSDDFNVDLKYCFAIDKKMELKKELQSNVPCYVHMLSKSGETHTLLRGESDPVVRYFKTDELTTRILNASIIEDIENNLEFWQAVEKEYMNLVSDLKYQFLAPENSRNEIEVNTFQR